MEDAEHPQGARARCSPGSAPGRAAGAGSAGRQRVLGTPDVGDAVPPGSARPRRRGGCDRAPGRAESRRRTGWPPSSRGRARTGRGTRRSPVISTSQSAKSAGQRRGSGRSPRRRPSGRRAATRCRAAGLRPSGASRVAPSPAGSTARGRAAGQRRLPVDRQLPGPSMTNHSSPRSAGRAAELGEPGGHVHQRAGPGRGPPGPVSSSGPDAGTGRRFDRPDVAARTTTPASCAARQPPRLRRRAQPPGRPAPR